MKYVITATSPRGKRKMVIGGFRTKTKAEKTKDAWIRNRLTPSGWSNLRIKKLRK